MSSITFDTHKFVKQLQVAGFPQAQAEAVVDAVVNSQESAELVSKKDLQIELAPVRTDLTLLKWMMGILLAGVISLVMKAFLQG